jgi:hypothetical protein
MDWPCSWLTDLSTPLQWGTWNCTVTGMTFSAVSLISQPKFHLVALSGRVVLRRVDMVVSAFASLTEAASTYLFIVL